MGSVSDWYPLSDALTRILPQPVCMRRVVLLPLILEEWTRSELPELLSIKSRPIKSDMIKKLKVVRKHARGLQEALKSIGENGRTAILAQMTTGSGSLNERRSEIKTLTTWLEQESAVLEKLVAVDPWSSGSQSAAAPETFLPILLYRTRLKSLNGLPAERRLEKSVVTTKRKSGHSSTSYRFCGRRFLEKASRGCQRQ